MSSSSSLNNVRNLPESSHYQPPLPPTQSTISKPLPLLNDFLITPPKHQLQQQPQPSLPTLDSKLFDLPSPNTNVPIIIPSSSTDHSSPLPSTQPSSSLPTAKQSTSSSSDTLDTLNEPIYDTIKRDCLRIGRKLYYVLNPYKNEDKKFKEIRQWDLWGPLIFTILLSFTLSFGTDEKSDMFVLVFVIFWIGSVLVYLNGNLLGAKIGMFPVICLIGYCMVPLNICAFVLAVGYFHFVVKLLFVGIACGWSVYSSVGFMKNAIEEEKMLLLVYPVVLEFLFLSAVVYMNKQ